MSARLIQYTCCLFVLTSWLDQGDGRWKRKDEENLRHDIDLFKELAEKIEEDIDTLYVEYSEENVFDEFLRKPVVKLKSIADKKVDHIPEKNMDNQDSSANTIPKLDIELSQSTKSSNYNGSIRKFVEMNYKSDGPKNKLVHSQSNWPTFDDILLAVGKKYDWKNDRWIKVRRKEKDLRNNEISEDKKRINFMKIHKFSYSIVKLNKSKSKKNVVVAVSAVR